MLLAIPKMKGGGAQHAMAILCNQLVKNGVEVCLCYTGESREPSSYPLEPRIEVLFPQSPWMTRADKALKGVITCSPLIRKIRLRRKIRRFRPQIIIAFMESSAMMILWACEGLNIPVVFAPRNSLNDMVSDNPAIIDTYEEIFPKFDGVVYQTSEQQRQYFEQFSFSKNAKHTVITNLIDPSPLWDLPRKPCHGVIVAVGRDQQQKNYPLLFQAFSMARKKIPGFTLSIYGEVKSDSPLRSLAQELGIDGDVIFNGFCSDVQERIRDASIFVMASRYEGFPNALIEALCLGLPCITTDFGGGGALELIVDGENGLIVPNEDADALAAAMCRLMGDPEYAEQLGENAALLREKHRSEKLIQKWIEFISSVVLKNTGSIFEK